MRALKDARICSKTSQSHLTNHYVQNCSLSSCLHYTHCIMALNYLQRYQPYLYQYGLCELYMYAKASLLRTFHTSAFYLQTIYRIHTYVRIHSHLFELAGDRECLKECNLQSVFACKPLALAFFLFDGTLCNKGIDRLVLFYLYETFLVTLMLCIKRKFSY